MLLVGRAFWGPSGAHRRTNGVYANGKMNSELRYMAQKTGKVKVGDGKVLWRTAEQRGMR